MADEHVLKSIDHVVDSDYALSNRLAASLTDAILKREEAVKALSVN